MHHILLFLINSSYFFFLCHVHKNIFILGASRSLNSSSTQCFLISLFHPVLQSSICWPNYCVVGLHCIFSCIVNLNWCDGVELTATVTNTVAWVKFFMLDLGKGSRLRTQTRMLSKSAVEGMKRERRKEKRTRMHENCIRPRQLLQRGSA